MKWAMNTMFLPTLFLDVVPADPSCVGGGLRAGMAWNSMKSGHRMEMNVDCDCDNLEGPGDLSHLRLL